MYTADNSTWSDLFYGHGVLLRAENSTHKVRAKLVETYKPVADSYGDVSGECSIVFEVDGKFFKKTGYTSSYEGFEWDGSVYEVQPFTQTITTTCYR